jgi:hypothetical protein
MTVRKATVRWRISLSLFLIHTRQTTINIVWSNQILGFPHNSESLSLVQNPLRTGSQSLGIVHNRTKYTYATQNHSEPREYTQNHSKSLRNNSELLRNLQQSLKTRRITQNPRRLHTRSITQYRSERTQHKHSAHIQNHLEITQQAT